MFSHGDDEFTRNWRAIDETLGRSFWWPPRTDTNVGVGGCFTNC